MIRLYDDRDLRAEMAGRAVAGARRKSWERLLDRLWGQPAADVAAAAPAEMEEPTTISAWRARAS